MPKKPTMLAGLNIMSKGEIDLRMALLLWGDAGIGKTTFAATAPGKKLWLSMGDNEHVSVIGRGDIEAVDLSAMSRQDLFKQLKNENPLGLDTYLAEHTDIETVVFDSCTALVYRALERAVYDEKVGASRTFVPTMEAPGRSAYGGRNQIVVEVLQGLMRVTAKHGVHFITTAHEDDPTYRKDERGNETSTVEAIKVMLGGKILNNVSFRFSEIWCMRWQGVGPKKHRTLTVRAHGLRKPMKTRMFRADQHAEFELTFDAAKPDARQAHTIAKWHDAWEKASGAKINVPAAKKDK